MAIDPETDEELEKPDTDEEEKPQPIGGAISRPVIPQRDYAEEIPPSVTGMNYAAPAPPPVSVTSGPLERPHPAADRLAQLESTPAAITQKHGIGGGILKGLEVAGSVLAPNAMERIPGTRLNRDYQIGQAEKQATDEATLGATEEGEKRAQGTAESEASLRSAQEDEARARAEALRNPPPKLAAQTPEQETLHDLMTGDNGNPRVNPATGKPYSYVEAYTQVKQAGEKPTVPKTESMEQQYDDAIKGGDTKRAGQIRQEMQQIAGARREPKDETDKGPGGAFDRASAEAASKDVETARGGDFRFRSMSGSYPKALKGDQQAMVNLLTNHIGMTLGMQKGARITKDILHEAQSSTPWLQGLKAKWDSSGYLTGVVLTPEQMKQMMGLAASQRGNAWAQAIESARQAGVSEKLKIPGDVRIRVLHPNGTVGTIPGSDLSKAEDKGYTVAPQ